MFEALYTKILLYLVSSYQDSQSVINIFAYRTPNYNLSADGQWKLEVFVK